MGLHVRLQVFWQTKLFAALITGIVAFCSVREHVYLEAMCPSEGLSTLTARVRFLRRVNSQVTLQFSFTLDTLPTLMACERSLSRVNY